MPVPSPRNSIRIARGNFADLNANAGAFGEGEFIYAIDQDRFYTAASGVLVAVGAGVVAAEGIDTLADVDTSSIPPGVGQVLKWDGAKWVPANDSNTDAVTSVAGKTGAVTLVKADITDFADGAYATAAQGTLADGAVQSAGDTMTGALGMPVGSAASPSVYFDADTGLYSPGDNQVALATNGAGRLFVDASGNVAVNTSTSTTSRLEVSRLGGAWTGPSVVTGTALALHPGTGTTSSPAHLSILAGNLSNSVIYFGDTDSTSIGAINYIHTNDSLRFDTNGTERMRLDSSGRLGLGASAPEATFQIGNANAGGSATHKGNLQLNEAVLGLTSNGGLEFKTSNFGSGYGWRAVGLAATGNPLVFANRANSATWTERLRIDDQGRVGIGTTSPSEALEVAGNAILDATDATLKIKAGVTGTTGALNFTFNTDSTVYGGVDLAYDTRATVGTRFFSGYPITIQSGASTNAIIFKQGSTDERARIDSSGRLLVGTSTSAAYGAAGLLQILGTTNAHASIARITDNNAEPTFNLAKARGAVPTPTIVLSDDVLGRINFAGYDGGDFESIGAWIKGEVDGTPGTNDMPGRLVFSTTSDGASSPTERMRIDSSGRVGIGTTSPQTSLDVNGSVRVRNGNGYHWIGESAATDAKLWDVYTDNTTANTLRFRCVNDAFSSSNTWLQVNRTATEPTAIIFSTGTSEKVRIDSSGRLLVGTSSAPSGPDGISPKIASASAAGSAAAADIQIASYQAAGGSGRTRVSGKLFLGHSRSGTSGTLGGVVSHSDYLGEVRFWGDDGTNAITAAEIVAQVDGPPGSNDMPGRLVFSTTASGASIPTERLRITNDGVHAYNQGAPAAVNATATLTVANLKTGIITSTSAAATDMTLPTGTDTEAGFSSIYTNMTFEWSVINTGPSLVRVLAGTAHTIVGSGSVATGTSGRFASRRTAANTFVTYRLS